MSFAGDQACYDLGIRVVGCLLLGGRHRVRMPSAARETLEQESVMSALLTNTIRRNRWWGRLSFSVAKHSSFLLPAECQYAGSPLLCLSVRRNI